VGKTALYGYHLNENRRPTHRFLLLKGAFALQNGSGAAHSSSIPRCCPWAVAPGRLCVFPWRPRRAWACPLAQAFIMRSPPGPGFLKERWLPESAATLRQGPCSSSRERTSCFTGPSRALISSFLRRRWPTFSLPRRCVIWRSHQARRILCTDWSSTAGPN